MTTKPLLALCLSCGLGTAPLCLSAQEAVRPPATDSGSGTALAADAAQWSWSDAAVQRATELAAEKIKKCAGERVCESAEVIQWQDFLRRHAQPSIESPDIYLHVSGEQQWIVDTLDLYSTRAGDSEMPLSREPGRGRGPSLEGEVLVAVDYKGRNLANARLVGRDLSRADLSGADLRFAFLTGANLEGAKLVGADLTGADLTNANLGSADLSGAKLFDGKEATAMPVAFLIRWNAIIFDTSSLRTGMFIKHIGIDKVPGYTFVTFLLLEGNGANVRGTSFARAKNLSIEHIRYICRWGERVAWKALGEACDRVAISTYNPLEVSVEPYPGIWLAR